MLLINCCCCKVTRGIQLLRSHLKGEGGDPSKCKRMQTRGEEIILMRTFTNFLIEDAVHKLLKKMTRFLVSFIKISVLLKIYSKNTLFCH